MGVITTSPLEVGTVFGPVSPNATVVDLTVLIGHRTCDTPPDIHTVTLNVSEYSDSEQLLTEWIPYVHAARNSSEQNVEVSVDHCNGQHSLFYTIIRQVAPNKELFVWYSDQLAKELGLPRITDSSKRDDGTYVCADCGECFRYPNSLRAHMRFRCHHVTRLRSDKGPLNSTPAVADLSVTSSFVTQTDVSRCSPISAAFGDVTNTVLPLHDDHQHSNGKFVCGKRRTDQVFDDVDVIKLYKRALTSSVVMMKHRQYAKIDNVTDMYRPATVDNADISESSPSPRNVLHRGSAGGIYSVSGLPSSLSINLPSPSSAISSMSPPGGHSVLTDALTLSSRSIHSFMAAAASFISTTSSRVLGNINSGKPTLVFPAPRCDASNENHPYLDYRARSMHSNTAWGQQTHDVLSVERIRGNANILNGFNGNILSNSLKFAATGAMTEPVMTTAGLPRFPFGGHNPFVFNEPHHTNGPNSSTIAVSSPASVPVAVALMKAGGNQSIRTSAELQPVLPPLHLAQNWCAKCNTGFRMTSDLVQHMRTHHKRESTDSHATADCHGNANSDVSGYGTKHTQSDSLTRALLRCEVCHELFRERHHLTRHMTSHT